jgi:hypothetical protein
MQLDFFDIRRSKRILSRSSPPHSRRGTTNERFLFDYCPPELQQDSAFWQKHGDFILSNPRGYGYWIWKSYLIQQKLLEIPDGDILL